MFNKKVLTFLANALGILTLVSASIFFVSGFFVTAGQVGPTAEKVGFFFGYELAGLSGFAFFYLILGVLARWNGHN